MRSADTRRLTGGLGGSRLASAPVAAEGKGLRDGSGPGATWARAGRAGRRHGRGAAGCRPTLSRPSVREGVCKSACGGCKWGCK